MKLKHDDPRYIAAMRLMILGEWDKAEKGFLELKDVYDESAFVRLALSNIKYSQGDLDASTVYCDEAIAIKPDFSTAYYKKGVNLYRMGRMELALEAFKKILAFPNQSHAMASYFIGLINKFLGREEEAIEAFTILREKSPKSKIANLYMGQLLYKQHRYEEAVVLWKELLEIAPEFAEVQFQMGRTLLAMHKNFEAIKYYKKALQLNPEDQRSKNALELLTDLEWP